MKVKNIMFSGFAAAILMGACGAADAATYNLASKGYVDKELSQKQSKLTAGDGISIVNDVISADTSVVATKTDLADYALTEDVVTSEEFDAAMAEDGELGQAIANASQAESDAAAATAAAGAAQADATQAKSDAAAAATAASEAKTTAGEAKADAAAATTAAGEAKQAVTELTTTVNSKADAQAVATALEGKVSTETYNTDKAALEQSIGTKADASDVYTKGEADALLLNKVDKTTLDEYYKKTETMSTEAIQAAIDDVKSGEVELTNYYTKPATDTLLGAKADKTAVEGIDTRVQAIENAGYQNADQVSATVSGAINTLDLANTYETKGTAASLDAALKSELQQEIQDNKYNDADVKQDIADNAAAIAANAEDIAENANAISGLQNAGYISGSSVSTQEGTFLVQSDGSGNVSLSSVAIVDENGNDLITGQPVE